MKIAFIRGYGFWASLIRLWTGGAYCHCELVFSDGTWFGNETTGAQKTSFHRYSSEQLASWDYLEIPISLEREIELRRWCETEVGCGYDWWGLIFSQVLFWDREHPSKWFCSEVCSAFLQKAELLESIPKAVHYSPSGRRQGLFEALVKKGFTKASA